MWARAGGAARRVPGLLLLVVTLAIGQPLAAHAQSRAPVSFRATDSLIVVFSEEEGDRGRLLGAASVTFEDITLDAHRIDLAFDAEQLDAHGLATDSGMVGMPQFTQGTESLTGTQLSFNLDTGRGRIVEAQSQFQEGFIQAGIAKMREDSVVFIQDGLYTTCNCGPGETPSYSLRARRMKVVDQKWVYTGPIQLFIFDIPLPIWLPFGFLPYQEGRRSGLLAPEYGEDQRGFYLRNWGWYHAINDHMDAQLRLGIWSKGSYQVNPQYRYNWRDRFNGNLNVDYLRERSGEREDPDLFVRNSISIRWTHNQTITPVERLSANVNLTSSSYLRTVSLQYDDNVRQSVGSSIQYNRTFRGGRSLSLSMRQNQILSTGNTDLALPELTFSQRTKTPFKRATGGRTQRWYERLQYSLSTRASNRYSYQPLTEAQLIANGDTLADGRPVDYSWYEALADPDKYRAATGQSGSRLDFTATHRVPIALPFDVRRIPGLGQIRLNISPNANYTESWFVESERQMADSTGSVQRMDQSGFLALRQFDMGASAITTIYGLFPLKAGAYQGLRHTVRPRLGFTYRPDFSADTWGYTRTLLDDVGQPVVDTLASGAIQERRYDLVRGVQHGLQQAITFGIDNTFETKRVRIDSVGVEDSQVLKLFTVNVSGSYNLAADSLGLAPVRINARTNVLGRMNVNLSSTLSPYRLTADGSRVVDELVFNPRRFAFARLTQLGIRGSMRLRGRMRQNAPEVPPTMPEFSTGSFSPIGIGSPFSQFSGAGAPQHWSMDLSFSYTVSRPRQTLIRSATVNTGFNFALTRAWRVRAQTGYDFEQKRIVTSTLDFSREFECWDMSFRWVPFGAYQSWGFDLHVKSSRLSEFLRLRQPKAERDRRFGLQGNPF